MSLTDRLKHLILDDGPMPVSTWMTLCLHDPAEGYYATRPGLGRDFRTAPETSQVFGELLGLWCVHEWQALGAPAPFCLAELGPGRGTLMADALRAAAAAEAFGEAMQLCLLEVSPQLRALQLSILADARPRHVAQLSDLPDGPALILGNEFLDCLPARQFVRTAGDWHERVIGLTGDGAFAFGLAADRSLDAGADHTAGEIDLQPGLGHLVETLAARSAPFRALFIDYGTDTGAPGDTLRAYRQGAQVHPLDGPGTADLTVDVDFGRLARLARAAGLDVSGPVQQGAFLGALGIENRMQRLISAHPDRARDIHAGVAELVEPGRMGRRFKAICLSSPGLAPPAGFPPPAMGQ